MSKKELNNQIKEICEAFKTQIEIIRTINLEFYKQGIEWEEAYEATWWRFDGKDAFEIYKVATSNWRQKATKAQELSSMIAMGESILKQAAEVENRGWKLLGY